MHRAWGTGAEFEKQWVAFHASGKSLGCFCFLQESERTSTSSQHSDLPFVSLQQSLAPGLMWSQRMWDWFSSLLMVSPSWPSFLRLHKPVPPYYWTTSPFPPYPVSSTEGPLFLWCLLGLWWSLFTPFNFKSHSATESGWSFCFSGDFSWPFPNATMESLSKLGTKSLLYSDFVQLFLMPFLSFYINFYFKVDLPRYR